MLEPGIVISLGLTCIGAIVWAVRVEGKVKEHDKTFIDLGKLLDERDRGITERLKRIESAIDRGFNNGRPNG